MKARSAVLIVAGAINSCASNTPAWEDADAWRTPPIAKSSYATASKSRATRARAARPSVDAVEKMAAANFDGWAASFQTPNRCVLAARPYAVRNPKEALLRLTACSRRPRFDVLMPLLRSPWNELLLDAKPVAYRILLRAIAVRREFEADFGSVVLAGFPIGQMGIDSAEPGRLTPIVGVPSRASAAQVEELGRGQIKRKAKPGRFRRDVDGMDADAPAESRQAVSQNVYKIDAPFKPGRSVLTPTGKGIQLARRPRCSGSGNGPKVMFVRLGRSLRKSNAGVQLFEGRAVACHTVPDLPPADDGRGARGLSGLADGELPGVPWTGVPSQSSRRSGPAKSPPSRRKRPRKSKKVVYCAYLTGMGMTHVSYCINAPLADAKVDCADRLKRQGLDSVCECTDDKSFIGSRCG